MAWIPFALICAALMSTGDLFLKLASGRVSNSVGVLLYGTCTFLTGLIWTLVQWRQGLPLFARPAGVAAGLAVGVSFGLATIFLYTTYAQGGPVSTLSPFIRLASVLTVAAVGIVAFREPFSLRYVLGLVLAVSGVYLIVTR